MNLLLSIVFLSSATASLWDKHVIVHVKQGDLRGLKVKTDTGVSYYSFRGIAYAKPPVGPDRFKAPEPPASWKGVRDALGAGPWAPQVDVLTGGYTGSEDCLYLNVYTPMLPSGLNPKLKPVLVYVHGGGFLVGSGSDNLLGPGRFMNTKEVVLVTINYRLGAFGFMSTGDSVVPGNNGLKDQVLSLRWVKENIARFGGDPKKVTIAGYDSGASSTHLHLTSPMSKDLFDKCISESGSAFATWSVEDADVARTKAFRLGQDLGIETTDSKKLVEFLRTIPPEEIVNHSISFLTEDEKHPVPFSFRPVVEQGIDQKSMFLPEKPLKLIRDKKLKKVPFIIGVTSKEGLLIAPDLYGNPSWYEGLNNDLEPVFVSYLNFKNGTSRSRELTEKIKKHYFGKKPISNATWGELVDIYGDVMFNIWADKAAKEQTKVSDSPLYLYKFCQTRSPKAGVPGLDVPGAAHIAETRYLFETSFGPIVNNKLKGQEKKMSKIMIRMWTNFVKTGNPTPKKDRLIRFKWLPFTQRKNNHLDISIKPEMQKDLLKKRIQFWNNLLSLDDILLK